MTPPRRAVAVTVDNLAEAADVGRGRIDGPLARGHNPTLDTGFPALLDLLDAVEAPVTWFVEGWNGREHPDEVAEIARRGHDVGVHGWLHEAWSELATKTESALLDRAVDALGAALGEPPTAFRAPGGRRRPDTLALLAERGIRLDASLAPDGGTTDRPVHTDEGPIWLGYHWALVDATYWLWDDLAAATAAERMRDALDQAAPTPGTITVLIVHPHVTGMDASRLEAVQGLLTDLRDDPDVQFVSLAGLG